MSSGFLRKLSRRLGAFLVPNRAFHKVKSSHLCFGEVLLDLNFCLTADVIQHVIYHRKPIFDGKFLSSFASARVLKNNRQDLKNSFIRFNLVIYHPP